MDVHEEARALIASCLAVDAATAERRRLAEHLAGCPECRREMELAERAVRALGELAFAPPPGLAGRVEAALARRARELDGEGASRHRRLLGFLAVAMTAASSLGVWKVAAAWVPAWMPIARHLSPGGLAALVAIFWVLPSLAAAVPLLAPSAFASLHGEEMA